MSIARLAMVTPPCPLAGSRFGLSSRSPGQPLLFPGLVCNRVALTRHGSGPRMERSLSPLKQAGPKIQDPQNPIF